MLNPILAFSATRRMRSFRTILVVAAYLAVLLGIVLLTMGSLFGGVATIYALRNSVACYNVLMIAQFILIVLIAPAMTSGTIAGERERQTLELLLVTNTRSFRIVTGKAMESFALLALLIVSGLPVMCLTMIAGAVTLPQILAGELFLLAIAFAAVCVGVFASSIARTSMTGGIISYLILLGIAGVTTLPLFTDYPDAVTDIVYNANKLAALPRGEALRMISPLLLFNPGYGLVALLQGQTNLMGDLLEYQSMGRILCGFTLMDKAGGETVALISCAAVVLLGAVLLLAAALILRRTAMKTGGSKGKGSKE